MIVPVELFVSDTVESTVVVGVTVGLAVEVDALVLCVSAIADAALVLLATEGCETGVGLIGPLVVRATVVWPIGI